MRIFRSWTLRALLIFVAGCAILIAIPANRARRQRKAVEAITALGGTVHYDFEVDDWGNLIGDATSPLPRWLEPLGIDLFLDVASIHLNTNEGHDPAPITSAMQGLADLPDVRFVKLFRVTFEEKGFASFRHLRGLKSLSLHSCSFREEWLAFLPNGGTLVRLNCNYTPLGDNGLKILAGQRGLTYLSLIETKVTDDGLRLLAAVPLTELDVARTAITDNGLVHLYPLHTLQRLLVYGGPMVSDEGVARIEKAIPGLRVTR